MQQINLEIGPMFVSAADPILRIQCIDLTKRWVDHAVMLNCPKVMVNQGQPSQENKEVMIAALKTVGDYAKSKGVKISMETRGGGGGNRARGAAAGAAGTRRGAGSTCGSASGTSSAGGPTGLGAAEGSHREVGHLLERATSAAWAQRIRKRCTRRSRRCCRPIRARRHMKVSANWDFPTFVQLLREHRVQGPVHHRSHRTAADAEGVRLDSGEYLILAGGRLSPDPLRRRLRGPYAPRRSGGSLAFARSR